MRDKRRFIGLRATLAILAVTLLATGPRAVAQRQKVLYSFGSKGTDGDYPYAGVTFNAGNLYGTTLFGGAYNHGTVFELTPKAGGGWTEKILHSFGKGGDGLEPYASVILDAAGNLYGTTYEGGSDALGTVFELTPKAGGGWIENVLHSFNGKDGEHPYAGVILDTSGNLYGTTYQGGAASNGTVFELTPKGGGGWTEKVLHSFGSGKDGASPYAGVIFDGAGNLYSTTVDGGADGLGTVFELTPKSGGKWAEKVLHSFNGNDGEHPEAGLILDSVGDLYGATQNTIFELIRKAGGRWTEKVLYNSGSTASLIFGAAGKLYGTTVYGGPYNYGTVFELTRKAGGKWTETTLFDFLGGADGAYPYAGLFLGASGNMYGTTYQGGARSYGTVFEITP